MSAPTIRIDAVVQIGDACDAGYTDVPAFGPCPHCGATAAEDCRGTPAAREPGAVGSSTTAATEVTNVS